MSVLNPTERKWVQQLQSVLDNCPSERLGFFTTGDCTVYLWDLKKAEAVHNLKMDFHAAVTQERAGFKEHLTFPAQVESTAG
jgi:hypothetical protein